MKMIMLEIADGFNLPRGVLFGFGTHADDDTGSMSKLVIATKEQKETFSL